MGAAAGGVAGASGGCGPSTFCERLIGALLVRISAANSNRADQLIVHHDGKTARNEVVGKALRLAEVQTNQAAIDGVESLRDRSR